ncbi:hypothetical protein AGOR_G00128850 [Albula goreensis]|uniref:Ig-like domain-containing protein n=1 Tax=Albula goreensis TaxID=1534307 RepID=A0A8T3D9D1_9TELE|nr:hypothetical protein AGOR_G00128850 [Albula goreensis]
MNENPSSFKLKINIPIFSCARCEEFYSTADMGHGVIWLIWTCYFILGVKCQDNGSTQKNATTLVQAEFGRSVVLPCNHQAQGRIRFMYMQTRIKPPAVVAGFHKQGMKNIDAKFKNRTKLGPNGTWVELSNVTINDKGDYECIIQTETETENTRQFTINLDVTARYSVPVLTAATSNESAGDRVSVVSCSSSGGYPEESIVWTLPPSSQWAEVNQSSMQNPVTKLFNVSSTIIIINCSYPFKLSCRLGTPYQSSRRYAVLMSPAQDRLTGY